MTQIEQKRSRFCFMITVVSSVLAALILSAQTFAGAQTSDLPIAYEEDCALSHQLHLPIYHWSQVSGSPRAIVVALHGLTMHGRTFGLLGNTLAAQGFDVFATDMRGYGRCMDPNHRYCTSKADCRHKIDYDKSYDDLTLLLRTLRQEHPLLPVFAVGESLGAALFIKCAAKNPELVDGLILSSPAIKRHQFLDPNIFTSGALGMANPRMQIDLMPFLRKYASNDPRVIQEKEIDPLLRRHMSFSELLQAGSTVRKTMAFVHEIPNDKPVLVMQGSADRCIKASAVIDLLANLKSTDQTVKWFHERGHILLETAFVKPDTMAAVVDWLNEHTEPQSLATRSAPNDVVARQMEVEPSALGRPSATTAANN